MKKLWILVFIFVFVLSGCSAMDEDPNPTEDYDYLEEGYLNDYTSTFGDYITSAEDKLNENKEISTSEKDTSSFSIDVDTASYSMFRKYVNYDVMPPIDDIRTEEMVNYFDYDYDQPIMDQPFSIETVYADCPWNNNNKLLMVGIQGKEIEFVEAPSNNLVLLIDVSGSMRAEGKLDMVKASLALLIENLRQDDYVSIVTYAGTAEIVLEPTSGDQQDIIIDSLNSLEAGGGTNGSGGIELAYNLAQQTFITEGNNRVILSTDGDFNIGTTTTEDLISIVTDKSEIGIYLTILGYGGNHQASYMMEELSNDGQGNYYFIDTLAEADKVLNHEIASTIIGIADDVKVQIEFNENIVESYRLIGYENRVILNEEFNDDKVDAGEIGAGHNVTAFYEVTLKSTDKAPTDTVATVRIRYKEIGEDQSKLIEGIIRVNDYDDSPNSDFLFASAVVEVSLLMRDSQYKGNASFSNVLLRIQENIGEDPYGLRLEFYELTVKLKNILESNEKS